MSAARGDQIFLAVYGIAHFGKSLTWYASEILFAFFLTEICGLSPHMMGYALGLSLIFNAATDVAVGFGLAKSVQNVEQAARFQLWGSVLSGVTLTAFAATGLMPDGLRFGFALGAIFVFRLAYTLYDSPQNAILGLAHFGPEGRVRLSSIRFVYSGLATLLVSASAAPLMMGGRVAQLAEHFVFFTAGLFGLGVISAFALRRVARYAAPKSASETVPSSPMPIASAAASRWRLARPLLLSFILSGGVAVYTKLEPYFVANAFRDPFLRSLMLSSIALSTVLGQPLWVWLAKTHRSRTAVSCAAALLTGFSAIAFMGLAGRGPGFAIGASFLLGLGASGASMFLWSDIAEAVAKSPKTSLKLSSTAVFGALTGVIKLAMGVSIFAVSQILSGIDYHNTQVAASWALTAPMAAAPLLSAVIYFITSSLSWIGLGRPAGVDAPAEVRDGQRP